MSDFLYINHVGLVVDDVGKSLQQIHDELGLPLLGRPVSNFGKLVTNIDI